MLLDDLKRTRFTSDIQHYAIPHVSLKASQSNKKKQPLFLVDDEPVKVEELAQRFFEKNSYQVHKGDDAHLFFSVLSSNFRESFFYAVCKNYVGQGANKLLDELEALVVTCLDRSEVSEELIEHAQLILTRYYSAYRPKRGVHSALARLSKRFDPGILLRLLKFYRALAYTTKGAPDLFIARGPDFAFVEVKSLNDSLSPDQYAFLERYLSTVGDNIYVLRVLPF